MTEIRRAPLIGLQNYVEKMNFAIMLLLINVLALPGKLNSARPLP